MKKILLIGGTGFLGSALASRLSCRPASTDFSSAYPSVRNHFIALPTRRPERVRHLAA